jgi:hypothetical protein
MSISKCFQRSFTKERIVKRILKPSGTAIKYQTCLCLLRCRTTTIPTISNTARISAPPIQVIAEFVVVEVEDEGDVSGFDIVAVAAAVVVTLSES